MRIPEDKMSPKGFILSSGCEIPARTPRENIQALIDATHLYGRFNN